MYYCFFPPNRRAALILQTRPSRLRFVVTVCCRSPFRAAWSLKRTVQKIPFVIMQTTCGIAVATRMHTRYMLFPKAYRDKRWRRLPAMAVGVDVEENSGFLVHNATRTPMNFAQQVRIYLNASTKRGTCRSQLGRDDKSVQSSHAKGRSSVCARLWITRSLGERNAVSQTPHLYRFTAPQPTSMFL